MEQIKTPLYDALENFYKKNKISFHVPGHKNGQIFFTQGPSLFQSVLSIDATELTGLDDLHAPEGPILQSQFMLANLYRVKKSFFLINGSTVGNLAMIQAVCEPGDTVFVQRNCHKSILHGLMLANANPVFLTPNYYEDWGIAGTLDAITVLKALESYPKPKAIILTYPNYYGLAEEENVKKIIHIAHEKNIPVLVDEAHGAHLTLAHPFPKSSISFGADIVVHSAHKTLPAMTMGSFLHFNSNLIEETQIEFYLQMLQSSSPSYPIMASLDLSRGYLASFTEEDQSYLLKKINAFKNLLSTIKEIEILAPPANVTMDPLKVTIRSTTGLSGYELQKLLEEKGIYTELADPQNVLFVLPLLKREEEYPFKQTVELIQSAVKNQVKSKVNAPSFHWKEIEMMTNLEIPYSEMRKRSKKQTPFKEAIGKIAGEMIIPYPPGIPLIMLGERITIEKINTLEKLISLGSRFHGGTGLENEKLVLFEK